MHNKNNRRDGMATPRPKDLARIYYHGTKSAKFAKKIMSEGIKPPDLTLRSNGNMTPVKGKVYITPEISYAQIYAIGGDMAGSDLSEYFLKTDGRYGYVFLIRGDDLRDIQPDEDCIGRLICNKNVSWLNHYAKNILKDEVYEYEVSDYNEDAEDEDDEFINKHIEERPLYDAVLDGEYDAWALAGKIMLENMEDSDKLKLIDLPGVHIAHEGNLPIKETWCIDKTLCDKLKRDGSNFFDVAEKVDSVSNIKEGANKIIKRVKKVFYHGTNNRKNALGIMAEGIKPPDLTLSREKGDMAPVIGKVYITPDIKYAQIYALGTDYLEHPIETKELNKGRYGYVFSIDFADVKEAKIQPDEDSIGILISKEKIPWLNTLAKKVLKKNKYKIPIYNDKGKIVDHNVLSLYQAIMSDHYPAYSIAGKIMLDKMTDLEQLELLKLPGVHIAHEGNLPIKEVWRIDKTLCAKLKRDGSNFFQLAKKIKTTAEIKKGFYKTAKTTFENKLYGLRREIAKAAQKIYDKWDQNDDYDELNGGGICQLIAEEICDILSNHHINAMTESSTHEQHVYVIAYDDPEEFDEDMEEDAEEHTLPEAFMIDIPYSIYEEGGGFTWKKLEYVEFDERDVVIYKVDYEDHANKEDY